MTSVLPEYIYHYYERDIGAFKTLSDLSNDESVKIMQRIKEEGKTFASKRPDDYLMVRRELETKVRRIFIEKGGKPKRKYPFSLTLGECKWLETWYKHPMFIKIPIHECEPAAMRFTYGDIFPAMRYKDGKPYRGKVYTLYEIPEVIQKYGLPQEWNSEGLLAPERYIECHLWDNKIVERFVKNLLEAR